ncbi:ABC transporter substrate-binding protein [Paenalcaligenes suwonensis]|uniref:ABC transporter substrate-binding protein n=1 Tax=Paenalcaligenes suwonensis TaxID=1202713 RepID=UPI001A9812B5|nr:ABC transporter substrate-binding protein [Paenalcaligenes suwonensis]
MKRKFAFSVMAATLCLALPFAASAAETVKIAIAGPFTGANAAFGDQLWIGAVAAAEQINANGGVNGKQIELIKGDDACEPKQAVAVANRLADQEKVAGVVGHFCSSSHTPPQKFTMRPMCCRWPAVLPTLSLPSVICLQ